MLKVEDIITGEKLQNLCELFIGTINSINWNPKMKNDNRWIEINNILKSNIILENPKYIYMCGEDIDYLPKIIFFTTKSS